MATLSRLRIAAQPLRRFFSRSRDYRSAAARRLDYDSDDYFDDDDDKSLVKGKNGLEKEGSDGCVPGRGVQWVIIGDPMAKRHVYAERLSKLLGVPHISMGTLVRQELHPHSSLYKQIARSVNQGELVPEEIVFGLLSKRLEEGQCKGESGFILDGLPRTRVQAEILDEITDVDLVLNLKSTRDSLMKGYLANGFYSPSREFFRMGRSRFNHSLQSQDGNLKSSRFNMEKLLQYEEQSKPLEEYYKKQRKLLDFTVSGETGETWHGLLAALHLQHVNVLPTSQNLSSS